jgi:hypothetical protein
MSAGSPVFTEVLQVSVDSSAFAAQMAQVEKIYEASLQKMQSSAQQFDGFEQVGRQVQGATSYIEQFGAAFEKALVRVPARLAVMALFAAAVAAVVEPIRLLNEGMDNLENHSDAFHGLTQEFSDFATRLETVAAVPLFDGLLSGMGSIKTFITENKAQIEGLAASFGTFLAAVIRPFFALFTENKALVTGLFQILGLSLNGILTTASLLLVSFKTLFGLIGSVFTALGKIDVIDGPMAFIKSLKDAGTDFWDSFVKKAESSVDEVQQLLLASGHLSLNILGLEQTKAPDTPLVGPPLAEQKAAFEKEVADVKKSADDAKEKIQLAVAERTLSHQAASPQIIAILDTEEKKVNALVLKYQELAKTAKDWTPVKGAEAELHLGKTGTATDDSLEKAKTAAAKAADNEREADRKIASAAMLKIEDEDAKAEIALIKKAVSEGRMTREAGVDADIASEQRRHSAAMSEIAGRDGAEGTEEAARRSAALAEEMSRNLRTQTALIEAHAEAVRQDADALEKFNVSQLNTMIAAKEANATEAETLGNRREHIALTKEIIQLKQAEASLELQAAKDRRSSDIAGSPEDAKDAVLIAQLQAKIAQLQTQANNAKYGSTSLGKFIENEDLGKDNTSASDQFKSSLHLDTAAKDYDNANTGLEKFAAGLEGATSVMTALSTAVADAVAAYKKNGALGAAASLLNNKSITSGIGSLADSMSQNVGDVADKVGSMAPIIGPMIGQMFSAITTLFSQGIQTMVNNINQQIAAINQQAQLKQIGIQQQIKELQQEEQTAISSLGGKKKAQSQLQSILTSLNSQIAQLQFQAAQTVQQFNDMATAGGLGNMTGVMAAWASTWQQINQQVEQYIQAGGSMATAAEYMNQQLQQQRQTLQDQVNQGDATAINDAIQLNQLLTQRVQMMKQEAATEFGLLNSDSLERRTSSAVQLGTQLTQQRQAFALQLQNTNSQIALDEGRVAAEGKIFSIATSLAALQAQSNALNLAALNEQLLKFQDMQTILKATNGLSFTPGSINPNWGLNGNQAPIPGEPTVSGPITFGPGSIVVQGSVNDKNALTLANAIAQNIRSGRTGLNTNNP